MALFLLLIILLAIAWGLADYQLQSRIEQEPPPPTPISTPVETRKLEVTPPVEVAVDGNAPTTGDGAFSDTKLPATSQDADPAEAKDK